MLEARGKEEERQAMGNVEKCQKKIGVNKWRTVASAGSR